MISTFVNLMDSLLRVRARVDGASVPSVATAVRRARWRLAEQGMKRVSGMRFEAWKVEAEATWAIGPWMTCATMSTRHGVGCTSALKGFCLARIC